MFHLRDVRWHRPLARRPRLLVGVSIACGIGVPVLAWLIDDYLRTSCGAVIPAYLLLLALGLLIALGGWIVALALSSHLLGARWRERHLVGEAYEEGDAAARMIAQGGDRAVFFLGLVVLSSGLLFAASVFTSGGVFFHFDRGSLTLTQLRSASPATQVEGLQRSVRQLNYPEDELELLRDAVRGKLSTEDTEVLRWAAWASGFLQLTRERDRLIELISDAQPPEVRAQAVEALARLQNEVALDAIIESFDDVIGDELLEEAWLASLGIAAEPRAGAVIRARFDDLAAENRPLAVWGVGRAGDVCAHGFLGELLDSDDDLLLCAVGDALKLVGTVDEIPALQALVSPEESYSCSSIQRQSLAYRMAGGRGVLVVANRESLREKWLDAAFNTAAPGLRPWFVDVVVSDDYSDFTRQHTYFLIRMWDDNLERKQRVADDCFNDSLDASSAPRALPVELVGAGDLDATAERALQDGTEAEDIREIEETSPAPEELERGQRDE